MGPERKHQSDAHVKRGVMRMYPTCPPTHWRILDFLEGVTLGIRAKRASIQGVWAYGRMKFERL